MSKTSHLSLSDVFFQAVNIPKVVFIGGSGAGGDYDAPQTLSRLGTGTPPSHILFPSIRSQRLQRLGCQAPLNANSWQRVWCRFGILSIFGNDTPLKAFFVGTTCVLRHSHQRTCVSIATYTVRPKWLQ